MPDSVGVRRFVDAFVEFKVVARENSINAPIRTIHLDQVWITKLLDYVDELDRWAVLREQEKDQDLDDSEPPEIQYPYRTNLTMYIGLAVGDETAAYLVVARLLSNTKLIFLHGGFLHENTHCRTRLINKSGDDQNIRAKVHACRYISGNIHEVTLLFEQAINAELYISPDEHARIAPPAHETAKPHPVRLGPVPLNARTTC